MTRLRKQFENESPYRHQIWSGDWFPRWEYVRWLEKKILSPEPAPQDLRERAEKLFNQSATIFSSDYGRVPAVFENQFVNAMLQFASEVSAGKDKRINELEIHMNALKQNAKARIAELEQQVKDLHKQLFDEIDFGKLEDPL